MNLTEQQQSQALKLYNIVCKTSDELLFKLSTHHRIAWSITPITAYTDEPMSWYVSLFDKQLLRHIEFDGKLSLFKSYYIALTAAINNVLAIPTALDSTMFAANT
jgi:hypothetical protein